MGWNFFEAGGIVMYPLLVCSLIIWAIIFEKYWSIYNFVKIERNLYGKAIKLIKSDKVHEAKGLYSGIDHLLATPHQTLFNHFKDKQLCQEKMQRRLAETQMGLKRFLWILATIASLAPFLGLFGTVLGIIDSFDAMAQTGKGGFSVVAAGIAEALISTAAGILVAVVALVFYNYFQMKINKIFWQFKQRLEDLADSLWVRENS
ncbi:MAG: MotA/TolQ/ExbB proton channel family protein [Bacteriovoracia bacterium]